MQFFYTQYGGKGLDFIYWKVCVCLYVQPDYAVCVCVMFNNHYNNFMAYTFQMWPIKRGIPNPMSLS